MRVLLSTLVGFCLIALWSVALVSHHGSWLAWADVAAGTVSVMTAFRFARGRDGASRTMAAVGTGLLAASLVAAASGSPRWLYWTSFALACVVLVPSVPVRSARSRPRVMP
jgi:hypothetical protein